MAKARSKSVEAIDMLKQDHDKVEKGFKEFEELAREDAEACHALIMSVCEDLKVHTTLEEEIFYPAVHDAIENEEIMNEAAVEHETARMLIEQLENMQEDDPNYHATFTVLGEYVRHHIREEEGEMFPAARKSDIDFDVLGARLRERREELMGETEKGVDASASTTRAPQAGERGPELTRRR
jgi:hemerythrin-like domain-containing protein